MKAVWVGYGCSEVNVLTLKCRFQRIAFIISFNSRCPGLHERSAEKLEQWHLTVPPYWLPCMHVPIYIYIYIYIYIIHVCLLCACCLLAPSGLQHQPLPRSCTYFLGMPITATKYVIYSPNSHRCIALPGPEHL